MNNPVVLIRQILDELMLDYDGKSFDKAELYCWRNPKDVNMVFYGTPYDVIEDLLRIFDGFIIYKEGLLWIGTKGQTYCPLDEAVVDSSECDQCRYYRDPWYSCSYYKG